MKILNECPNFVNGTSSNTALLSTKRVSAFIGFLIFLKVCAAVKVTF